MNVTPLNNKVENSGIITVDILEYKPLDTVLFLDIKDFLYMGLIIREKDFKALVSNYAWEKFKNKPVAIGCTADTIIPTWVFMMLADKLQSYATVVAFTTTEDLTLWLWLDHIARADFSELQDKKVVVRAHFNIHPSLYIALTTKLKPLVKTLMYGEAGMPKVIYKK